MMPDSIKSFFSAWPVIRIIRLGLGLFILIEGIKSASVVSLILGGLLLLQVVLNVGCCSTAGRATDGSHKGNDNSLNTDKIEYEEIK